ncbi:MAG: M20/M25/M40 family metallo-hydrolase [Deltaproteobacteria bacterium]|nr:M20/M25/M40 family metallo-hydrolase [Deltaproteobacteria bacterium]
MSHSPFDRQTAVHSIEVLRPEFERELKTLVDIPTVSAQVDHKPDIARGVEAAAALIRKAGGAAEVLRPRNPDGNPIVLGRLGTDPEAPTVTVYNHMDVQPADREQDGWTSEPFEMTIDGDRYRGRGTTDDKGPALSALFGARYARQHGVRTNVAFLWEFEEEIGSPSFEAALEDHRDRLSTSSIVVSDTIWISRGRPAVPAGLRGLQGFLLRLRTGQRDEHSGVTGGAARNPIAELMGVVCECFDPYTGQVRIPGFYDEVIAPTDEEFAGFKASGFTVEQFMKDHQFSSLRSTDPLEVMSRIWARPTFEVHGVVGGYSGAGLKTIVPPYAEVKVSCRLVPSMTGSRTAQRVREFIQARHPDIEVITDHTLEPYAGQTSGPLADAISSAIEFGFGARPVFVREGGSIGAVLSMQKILGKPISFLGLSLPEHGYHAPNEFFDWGQAQGGILAFADYFRRLGG